MSEPERRFAEIRLEPDSRRLVGTAIKYGDTSPGHRERFEAGAFGDVQALDLVLNYQHDRGRPLSRSGAGLELADGEDALEVSATIVETDEGNNALSLVRAGIVRGFSIEFFARQAVVEKGIRIIRRAELAGLSLVDKPSYPGSMVSAREKKSGGRRVWL